MTPRYWSSEALRPSHGTRRRNVGLTWAAALLLAACGGSSSDGSSDTTPPTVAITDDVTAATATGDVTFSFTFSEDVGTSFADADVAVTGGTKGTLTRVASTLYRLVVTPTPNALGTIAVNVPAGAFSDLAGNPSAAAASWSQDYDTQVALTQMALPVTFESATVAYGLVGFGGADDSTVVVDPTDAANHVAKVVKSATAETWAGTTITTVQSGVQLGFATKLPFDASNTRMTVRVWSPDAGIPVRLKAEDHTNNTITVETEATTTVAGGWETLTFDFANQAAGTALLDVGASYDKVSIFFNFNVGGATAGEKTYYFDDLVWIGGGGTGGGGGGAFETITFESGTITYTLTDFGGNASAVEVDPTNAANHVARVLKTEGAQTWAGTTVSTGAGDTVGKIPFDASNTRMTVRVWSPDAGIPVRLKTEDHTNGAVSVETEATTTVAAGWETLTFDFANEAAGTPALNVASTYDRLSIFFDFGATGPVGGKTYYLDDVTFIGGGGTGGGGGVPFENVTFESATITYTMTDFGGNASALEVDPDDAGNHVARVTKTGAAETWAGTTVSTGAGNTVGTIPFTATRTQMTVRVWSPDAGIQIRLKVEDHTDPTKSVETEATTTVAAGWETLTFDFANEATGTAALNLANTYDRLSIFFNFGVTGGTAGEKTYYLDDVTFLP